MKRRFSLIIIFGIFLLGCSLSHSVKLESNAGSIVSRKTSEKGGQHLPISARAIVGEATIELEVAKTPEQQTLGLMYRTSLPDNRGMLFIFDLPRYARFWMKNVSIPLDMIFLQGETVTAIFSDVPPCQSDPCPTYGPQNQINQVIELRGGRAKELGLKVGDRIKLEVFK